MKGQTALTMLLHDLQELDDDLGAWSDQDLDVYLCVCTRARVYECACAACVVLCVMAKTRRPQGSKIERACGAPGAFPASQHCICS